MIRDCFGVVESGSVESLLGSIPLVVASGPDTESVLIDDALSS